MSWRPFIADVEEWKKHFLESTDMNFIPNQKSYIVGQFGHGNRPSPTQIELVTPTQQAVEMAKSEIKKRKQEGEPIVSFTKTNEKKRKRTETDAGKTRNKKTKKRGQFVYAK